MMKFKLNKKYKKPIVIGSTCLIAILICIKILTYGRIATINLPTIITNYEAAHRLNHDYEKQMNELSNWIDDAKKEIDAEKKYAKKENLIHEYQEIARQRKTKIKSAYDEKVKEVEENLKKTIRKVANRHFCHTILTNSSVVQGGTDITEDVIKVLKKQK